MHKLEYLFSTMLTKSPRILRKSWVRTVSSQTQYPIYLLRPEKILKQIELKELDIGDVISGGAHIWTDASNSTISRLMSLLSSTKSGTKNASELLEFLVRVVACQTRTSVITTSSHGVSLTILQLSRLLENQTIPDSLVSDLKSFCSNLEPRLVDLDLHGSVCLLYAVSKEGIRYCFSPEFTSQLEANIREKLKDSELEPDIKVLILCLCLFKSNHDMTSLVYERIGERLNRGIDGKDILRLTAALSDSNHEMTLISDHSIWAQLSSRMGEVLEDMPIENVVKLTIHLRQLPASVLTPPLLSLIFSHRLTVEISDIHPSGISQMIKASLMLFGNRTQRKSVFNDWVKAALPLYADHMITSLTKNPAAAFVKFSFFLREVSNSPRFKRKQICMDSVSRILDHIVKLDTSDVSFKTLAFTAGSLLRLRLQHDRFLCHVGRRIIKSNPADMNDKDVLQLVHAFSYFELKNSTYLDRLERVVRDRRLRSVRIHSTKGTTDSDGFNEV